MVGGDFKGTFISPEDNDTNHLHVNSSLVESDFVIGVQYETKVTLPSIFMSTEGRADRVNIPQITFLYLDLYYSGRYEVVVDKLGYESGGLSIEQTRANIYDATPYH